MFNENELKISLTQKEYDQIKSACDKQPTLQINHYFDTTFDLKQMVRIRQKGDRFALQYKNRCNVHGNVFNSQEQGVEVDKQFLQTAVENGLDKDFANRAFGCNFDKNLAYLGCSKTYRLKIDYFGHEIELDKNVIDGDVDFELEYECDDEGIQKLVELLLQQGIEIKPSSAKYQRFLIKKGII